MEKGCIFASRLWLLATPDRRWRMSLNIKIINDMGKAVGMIGGISGKVGNVVYYYRNGVQVARVYVPNPGNPKSAGQTAQRLRMALTGRLSKIVPDAAIEGFDGSKTERRSKFNSNVLLNSAVENGRASILFQGMVFSEGTLGVQNGHTASAGSSSLNQRALTITTTHGQSEAPLPEGYGERYVVLCMNTETSLFDYGVTGLLTMPAAGETSASNSVVVRIGDKVGEYLALIYVVPFIARGESGGGVTRYSYLGTEDGTIVVDELTGESLGRPELFGQSVFIRSLSLPAPQQANQLAADGGRKSKGKA